MSFLKGRNPEDILGKHSNESLALSIFILFVDDVVDPSISLLKDEGNSIDVKQEEHFHPLLVACKLRVIAVVPDDYEFIVASFV
jgi:hypothetical protein